MLQNPFMFLANFIFVSHLKIHQAFHLNTLKALTFHFSRKVYQKFTSFRYSYVLTRVKKDKMVAEHLDVQIEQTILI